MKPHTSRCTALLAALVLVQGFISRADAPRVPSGTWAPTGGMSSTRTGAAATLLADGRVLMAGGEDADGPSATAELYDGDAQVFSPAASMGMARTRAAAVVLGDGRVLVTGGLAPGGDATSAAEIYDPGTDSWSAVGDMAEARSGHTVSLVPDGRVLIAGGESALGVSSTLELFDPSTNTFAPAGALSSPRKIHAAALLTDGRVLIAGGSDGTTALSSTDIFDPATGQGSPGPALSTARAAASATTLLDGKVLIAGGSDGPSDLASAEVYDPAVDSFSATTGGLATARQGHLAFRLPFNNQVLIVGGTSGGEPTASAELFAPWSDVFSDTGALSEARADAAGSPLSLDGRLLVAGGSGLSTAELYGFATVKTDKADYAAGETVTISGSGWQPSETVNLRLTEVPKTHDDRTFAATADEAGNILNNEFAPEEHDAGVRFYLTASGARSQAQATFTDAPAPKITANDHEGQKKVDGVPDGYTNGNVTEYSEGDSINFRFTLDGDAGTSGQLEVRFTRDGGGCMFFEESFQLGTIDNVSGTNPTVTVGTLAASPSGDEWVQTLGITFGPAGKAIVNYTLTLTEEAADCNGSSQHSRLNAAGGDVAQVGAQNVPVPANKIIKTCPTAGCDDGNPCTTDTCDSSTGFECAHNNVADGTSCSDGNACNGAETCQSGTCTGSSPIACPSPDQCHTAGTCDPATGICSNPAKADGASCDDGLACTTGDSCHSGACTGTPVVCTALDQCHLAGTCDATTGLCSNPAKPNGSGCNDGLACTTGDSCQSGVCIGTPVVCTALDQCHLAGVCNPMTGQCSNVNKPDHSPCDDGDSCTTGDTCQAGVCTGGAPSCGPPPPPPPQDPPTTTTVSCNPSTASRGPIPTTVSTRCTATVSDVLEAGPFATGTVSFFADGATGPFATCTINGATRVQTCSVTYGTAVAGPHPIVAVYGGDGTHVMSTGATVFTVTVRVVTAPGWGRGEVQMVTLAGAPLLGRQRCVHGQEDRSYNRRM